MIDIASLPRTTAEELAGLPVDTLRQMSVERRRMHRWLGTLVFELEKARHEMLDQAITLEVAADGRVARAHPSIAPAPTA